MSFNPKDHLTKMGNREYLEVKWRLLWFRETHPLGRIETDIFTAGELVYVKAIIVDGDNHVLATGMATIRDATQREATWSGRIVEKAETAAIGRALAVAGFGTQFQSAEEDEGEHLADSPIEKKQAAKPTPPAKKDPLDPDTHGLSKDAKVQQFKTKPVTEIEVRQGENGGKPYMVIAGLTLFSRAPFRELGYPKHFTEGELKAGKLQLPKEFEFEIVWEKVDNKKTPRKIIHTALGKQAEIK